MACSRVKTEDKEEQDAIMPEEVTLEGNADRAMCELFGLGSASYLVYTPDHGFWPANRGRAGITNSGMSPDKKPCLAVWFEDPILYAILPIRIFGFLGANQRDSRGMSRGEWEWYHLRQTLFGARHWVRPGVLEWYLSTREWYQCEGVVPVRHLPSSSVRLCHPVPMDDPFSDLLDGAVCLDDAAVARSPDAANAQDTIVLDDPEEGTDVGTPKKAAAKKKKNATALSECETAAVENVRKRKRAAAAKAPAPEQRSVGA